MSFIFLLVSLSFLPTFIHTSVPFHLNPGCNVAECQSFDHPALYYANHPVGNDVIHMIYSSLDELTITVAETSKDIIPTFNYAALFARNYTGAIQFGGLPLNNSLSLILRNLIEFNDINDNGLMDDGDNTTFIHSLANIRTSNASFSHPNTDQPSFQIDISLPNGTATLNVDIVYPGENTRDKKFPKLRTTPKSFFLNLALNASNLTNPNTRFAFEIYLALPAPQPTKASSSRFIDDQYTPGIFNVWQLKTTSVLYPFSMLWKPVVYLSGERTIEQNTLMQIYSLKNNVTLQADDQGIFYSVLKKPIVSAFNVSLGEAKDGFFAKTNYAFIQFTAGLDSLEADSTTQFVTVALVISLALPVLVGIIAVIVIIRRRMTRKPTSSYDTIDE